MALNATVLKGLIVTELQGQGFTTTGADVKNVQMAEAIANAVVAHIQTASVLVPITTDTGIAGAGIITGTVG